MVAAVRGGAGQELPPLVGISPVPAAAEPISGRGSVTGWDGEKQLQGKTFQDIITLGI